MSKYAITAGVQDSPVKTVLYGPEGIGKSTFASHFPDPVFIDTEGGTKRLNIKRLPQPTSWAMLLDEVAEVRRGNIPCGTLVIDTADWAERLAIDAVCAKAKVDGLEGFGYGKGYTYLKEEFGKLLDALEEVLNTGHNVLVPCPRGHHQVRAAGRCWLLRPLDHEDHQAGRTADPGVVRYAALCQLSDRGGKEQQCPQRKEQGHRRPPGHVHHPSPLLGCQEPLRSARRDAV